MSNKNQRARIPIVSRNDQLAGLVSVTPKRFGDHRGFFAESYSRRGYAGLGIAAEFVQDNHSLSAQRGTVRGLHYQAPPHAQAKLVRCGRGAIFDVVVDIRLGSPTYGHWAGCELRCAKWRPMVHSGGIWPHGFMTLEPDSEIIYKCSDYYAPETEGSLLWRDPVIGIHWPLEGDVTISDKDAVAPLLADLESPFIFKG